MWTHLEAHPGHYLRVRFLEPLGLSAAALARGCRMPRSRVSEILAGERRITADTAIRLAAFFRMEPADWMALQADWDLEKAGTLDSITPLDPPGFLLGPNGATPLPARRRADPPHLQIPSPQPGVPTPDREPPAPAGSGHEEVRYDDGTRALVAKRR